MLKMTIDNEEVLSNNDISIKEEILSPSSTILNNVYPKTWEQDKDYVSRFYYPKDYSKLNIQNFSVEPEEAGTTIQINGSATLTDVDTSKESRVLRLLGQTSQVQYTGKNLIPNNVTSGTRNGITWVVNNDGTILINGTATAQVNIPTSSYYFPIDGTYIVSGCPSGGNNNTYSLVIGYYDENKSWKAETYDTGSGKVLNQNYAYANVGILIRNGTTCNNLLFKPMLEAGSQITSYEPYVGGTASPNPSYPSPVNVVSGDNEINICGKNLFNANEVQIGKAWNGTNNSARAVIIIPVEKNVAYTISMNGNNSMEGVYVSYSAKTLEENYINGVGLSQITTFPRTYTSSTNYIILQFNKSSVSLSDIENLKLQVEKGSTATTYEPYIGSSYPLYLGVENLFDIDNAFHVSISGSGAVGTNEDYRTTDYLPTQPNTNYYFSTTQISGQTSKQIYICYYDSSKTFISRTSYNLLESIFTTPANTYFIRAGVYSKGQENVQLEIGTKKNSYTPYGTTPIELCKIGDYQDYIYKDNGSWYLHKEIGKVKLSDYSYTRNTTSTAGLVRYSTTAIPNIKYVSSNTQLGNGIAQNYSNHTGTGMSSEEARYHFAIDTAMFQVATDDGATPTGLFYYALATPTNTEITDTNLIEQLESLSS